ncbi:hypothetical protein ASZ90_004037 [hydrocarbon metagenome]|uniref:Uncharacterized protein n=1 Tax=hydrocarbon metagenome TaxID=938273 RepID=A0A0W8FZ43_9ZZZZ
MIPTWVFKGNRNGNLEYVILPSDSILFNGQYSSLTKNDRTMLIQSYNDIIEIFSKRTQKINFYSPSFEFKKIIQLFSPNIN